MIYHTDAQLDKMSLHQIRFSDDNTSYHDLNLKSEIDSEFLSDLLKDLFFGKNKEPEFHGFDTDKAPELIRVSKLGLCGEVASFAEFANHITRTIGQTAHYPIGTIDVLICSFKGVILEDEVTEVLAVALFENRNYCLASDSDEGLELNLLQSISLDRYDKSLLIFNVEQESGYKILTHIRSSRKSEISHWEERCFPLNRKGNDYMYTKEVIQDTKGFLKDRATPLFDLDKTEEADIMSRSHSYLKKNDEYNSDSYGKEIFSSDELRDEFQDYRNEKKRLSNIDSPDIFALDDQAIKNQARIFKSILKLDKNFHVYIHGDREKIQKGVDESGRKYYIIFYDHEA